VSVCLTDTSGKEDVYINDVLVSENYAVYTVSFVYNCVIDFHVVICRGS